METGKYTDKGGGEQNVIEVDAVGEKVLVDYGNGKTVWYGREDYSTWAFVGGEPKEEIEESKPEIPEVNLPIEEPEATPSVEEKNLADAISEDLEKKVEADKVKPKRKKHTKKK